jgi:glucans biosynthesis protein
MSRHCLSVLCCLAAYAAAGAWAQDRPTEPFDRDVLVARAAEIAGRPHSLPTRPGREGRLTYDQYRSIRFDPAAGIWRGENRNFVVDLLYPGFIFDVPVNINLVVGGTARRVLFDNSRFAYGADGADAPPAVGSGELTGYSGFRVRGPLVAPDDLDEFLVFQGASYFRGVAKGQVFGLSARGLAVRTARPEGEEFPYFTDFWIERPVEGAQQLVIHALLQSPSVVGAYSFTARAGDETVVDVDAALFPRVDVVAYGIAPLTSMFLFDGSNRSRFDDYRNAVHDSDGLLIVNGRGERLWRPLANPRSVFQVSGFQDDSPNGFGLVQRKRSFEDYEDGEAQFERRPSAWVQPAAEWGPGAVELVEIPSQREMNDNIVVYWQPRTPLAAGQKAEFSYRLRFTAEPLDDSLARVVATRVGQARNSEGRRSFVVDFDGAGDIPADLVPEVWSNGGELFAPRGQVVPETGVYRVAFDLDPDGEEQIEMRVTVYSGGKPWGETWLYRWTR